MPGTITVGCKLPGGLQMQTYASMEIMEPVQGGPARPVKQAFVAKGPVKINGPALRFGQIPDYLIREGAALTFGVDADLVAQWFEQNKDSDIVKRGLIFTSGKQADVEAWARDHRSEKTGFEPVDPHNLPDEFRRNGRPIVERAPTSGS